MSPAAKAERCQHHYIYMFQNVHIWGSSETMAVLCFSSTQVQENNRNYLTL